MKRYAVSTYVGFMVLALGFVPHIYAWTIPNIDMHIAPPTHTPTPYLIKSGLQINPGLLKVSGIPAATSTSTPTVTLTPTAPVTPTPTEGVTVTPEITVTTVESPQPTATAAPQAREVSKTPAGAGDLTPQTIALSVIAAGVLYFIVRDLTGRGKKKTSGDQPPSVT